MEETAKDAGGGVLPARVARKLVAVDELKNVLAALRRDGKKIGFTNGCYDCCHMGHISSLLQSKALCDVLVVGVNTDEWIRAHKGPDRPVQDERTRATLLALMECVDYVVVFGEETALPLVMELRPDIVAKEGYALENWPEGRFIESIGGRAVQLKRVDGYSTTSLVRKMSGGS